jgi:hypothetical protein
MEIDARQGSRDRAVLLGVLRMFLEAAAATSEIDASVSRSILWMDHPPTRSSKWTFVVVVDSEARIRRLKRHHQATRMSGAEQFLRVGALALTMRERKSHGPSNAPLSSRMWPNLGPDFHAFCVGCPDCHHNLQRIQSDA